MKPLEYTLATEKNVKLIYVTPDFQNPTGRTWSLERRKQLMALAEKHCVPIIEDNPYGELRFEGKTQPSLKSMDRLGLVIFLGTFSKIFCPGLRIGWVSAPESILNRYIMLKQGLDLHTAIFNQIILDRYLTGYDIEDNIRKIRQVYHRRKNVMVETMKAEFPEEAVFTDPEGGLFTWAVLPGHINTRKLLEDCLPENVAFVPGGSFFPNGGGENTMRLNYSNMPENLIEEGISRLGRIIRNYSNVPRS